MRVVLLLAALGLATGCKASINVNAKTDREKREEDLMKKPVSEEVMSEASLVGPGISLMGARQDVSLADGAATKTCRCLRVALGQPRDPSFAWLSEVPLTDRETQLVVAVSSAGVACPGVSSESLGAAYSGYRQDGDDIIVLVETARFGRPVPQGAIIPKPFGKGQVYVAPRSKSVPYGGSLGGSDRLCRIGNVGTERTTPLLLNEAPGGSDNDYTPPDLLRKGE